MFAQILRPVARRAIARGTQNRMSHGHSNHKFVTFDEAPVPQGNWQEHFNKQQAKYNTQLIVGIATLTISCIAINRLELLYFNWEAPKPKQ